MSHVIIKTVSIPPFISPPYIPPSPFLASFQASFFSPFVSPLLPSLLLSSLYLGVPYVRHSAEIMKTLEVSAVFIHMTFKNGAAANKRRNSPAASGMCTTIRPLSNTWDGQPRHRIGHRTKVELCYLSTYRQLSLCLVKRNQKEFRYFARVFTSPNWTNYISYPITFHINA